MKKPVILQLANSDWLVEVTLCGGQLLRAWHRSSPHAVIFCGERARIEAGTAIRGGVPICWPWFGASPVEGRPIQGFARTALWEIDAWERDFIRMILPENNVPSNLRDFPFELASEIRLADSLNLALVMKNCGSEPVDISCALHTYFAVSDCEKVSVSGLENAPFTVKGGAEQPGEKSPVSIHGEVCRLYCPQCSTVTIDDPAWRRKIVIEKSNSNSTLLWNPGAKRCAQIADLADSEYHDFLCVEANRAGGDVLVLAPGETAEMSQRIQMI